MTKTEIKQLQKRFACVPDEVRRQLREGNWKDIDMTVLPGEHFSLTLTALTETQAEFELRISMQDLTVAFSANRLRAIGRVLVYSLESNKSVSIICR